MSGFNFLYRYLGISLTIYNKPSLACKCLLRKLSTQKPFNMLKLFSTLLLFALTVTTVKAQVIYRKMDDKTVSLLKKAKAHYNKQEYKQSAETYSKAFLIEGYKVPQSTMFNAACSWSKANNIDSAISLLTRITINGIYDDYNHIIIDPDLESLHNHPEWENIVDAAKRNSAKNNQNLDANLMPIIDTMVRTDQYFRMRYMDSLRKYGDGAPELKQMMYEYKKIDSLNLERLEKIIAEYGWPTKKQIGANGARTLFLVLQHADISTHKRYLPIVHKAAQNGDIKKEYVAYLEDRIAVADGKKQIYGSQIHRDSNSKRHYVHPIEDPEHVDERRAKYGMSPMSEYVRPYNIEWNVQEHIKQSIELMK